jgi:ectoine hydroxylase-related dioxygenase (phytanoyl-CoA dioxygenase family)
MDDSRLFTVLTSRVYIASDNSLTNDPLSASNVLVIYRSETSFIVHYPNVGKYWCVTDGELTLIDDLNNATPFRTEDCFVQGVNIDKAYNELQSNGYTILEKIVDDQVVNQMLSKLDLPKESDHQIRRGDLIRRDKLFGEALLHPLIAFILKLYLHPNSKCATWSSNTLYPTMDTTDRYDWHVDYPYHDMQAPWQKAPLSAQVLWCLDEFRVDNGGTHYIRGGHSMQTFPNTDNMMGMRSDILTAPKGSIVIAHGAWWHSQGINHSKESRTCLLGTFVQPWIKPKDNMLEQVNTSGDEKLKGELLEII